MWIRPSRQIRRCGHSVVRRHADVAGQKPHHVLTGTFVVKTEVVRRVLEDDQLVGDPQGVQMVGERLVSLRPVAVTLDLQERHAVLLERIRLAGENVMRQAGPGWQVGIHPAYLSPLPCSSRGLCADRRCHDDDSHK